MALTYTDQLPYLVLYSVASLLLLIRSHVFDEQSEWVRRRIGDPASISSVYLRGGAAFITAAVAASFVLTQTAASAPLAGAWDGVEDSLIGISQSVSRFLPTGGSTRPLGLAFGPDTQIAQEWTTSGALAVTIRRNPTDDGVYYWRARTYDKIDLNGWGQTTPSSVDLPPDARILDQRADDVPPDGHHSFTFTVTPGEFRSATILSPQTPINVDQPTRLTTVGSDGYFATLDRTEGSGPYTVTALTPINGLGPGQVNIAALRATETNYPDEIKALYLPLPDGSLGPNAQRLEAKILDEAASEAPIDLADQIVKELKSSTYEYATDVTRPAVRPGCPRPSASPPTRRASASTTRRRWRSSCATWVSRPGSHRASCPARATRTRPPRRSCSATPTPGSRSTSRATAGSRSIRPARSRNWRRCRPADPAASPPVRSSASAPRASRGSSRAPTPGSIRPRPGGSSVLAAALGPLVAVLALLLLAVGAVAFVVWQRGPRGGTTADDAYGTVTRIASRFGFGPRPNQTVYEYAGVLSDVLPIVRPELETVARAKVESVYAREILGDERIQSLKAAQRRLRVSLLRLAFRRERAERTRSDSTAAQSGAAPAERPSTRSCQSALFVGEGREVRRQVVGAQDRATGTELDDRDPAQVHRPHPEAIERQVEQRQHRDLEDPVVPDDDRPRLVERRRRGSRRPADGRACRAHVPRRGDASIPASAGRTRAATSGSASPPGAHDSSGARRQPASSAP